MLYIKKMLQISESAVKKILAMQKSSIHIYIEKGGCAEYKYSFTFDSSRAVEPVSFDFGSVKVIANKADVELLDGVEIDHKTSLVSEKFIVKINREIDKCSCGISFKNKRKVE